MLGNHTVAIVKGEESYELLEKSCSKIFMQVNNLIKDKEITVNDIKIPIELYMGGDYKVEAITFHLKNIYNNMV